VSFLIRAGLAGTDCLRVDEHRSLTTLCRAVGDELLVVSGDQLDRAFCLPRRGTPPEQLVAAAAPAFARHCGVLVAGDTAVLWTDHGALCPLLYARDGAGDLVVATSAAALLPSLTRPTRLTARPRGQGCTGFGGISAVPPGSLTTLDVHGGRAAESTATYYRLPEPSAIGAEEAVREVGVRLEQAVAALLVDSDYAGVLLSGGVDSSTVAALAAKQLATLRSYTVGTPYGDEFAAARRLAEHIGSKHEALMFTPADLARLLPRMLRLLETWDLGTLQIVAPICFALDRLRGRESVLLTGYGADLLFAGLGGAGDDVRTEQAIRAGVVATGHSNEFSPAVAEDCRIAVRHPYWSGSMISAALAVPAALKLRGNTVKWVLRQAAARIVPADVAFRTKVAIQDGTAMHRMFSEVLGADDRAAQAARLRELAGVVFGDTHAVAGGAHERASDADLAGLAS
jgi:carbapenam-3-carboxylate synthase